VPSINLEQQSGTLFDDDFDIYNAMPTINAALEEANNSQSAHVAFVFSRFRSKTHLQRDLNAEKVNIVIVLQMDK
jgi:hypothetical protein